MGGEWAGSILLSMEWGDKKTSGIMASLPNAGVGADQLVASLILTVFISVSGSSFYLWGWRLPFLFSVVLLIAGIVIRSRIDETPLFQKVLEERRMPALPIVEVLKTYPRARTLTFSPDPPHILHRLLAAWDFAVSCQLIRNGVTSYEVLASGRGFASGFL